MKFVIAKKELIKLLYKYDKDQMLRTNKNFTMFYMIKNSIEKLYNIYRFLGH